MELIDGLLVHRGMFQLIIIISKVFILWMFAHIILILSIRPTFTATLTISILDSTGLSTRVLQLEKYLLSVLSPFFRHKMGAVGKKQRIGLSLCSIEDI